MRIKRRGGFKTYSSVYDVKLGKKTRSRHSNINAEVMGYVYTWLWTCLWLTTLVVLVFPRRRITPTEVISPKANASDDDPVMTVLKVSAEQSPEINITKVTFRVNKKIRGEELTSQTAIARWQARKGRVSYVRVSKFCDLVTCPEDLSSRVLVAGSLVHMPYVHPHSSLLPRPVACAVSLTVTLLGESFTVVRSFASEKENCV